MKLSAYNERRGEYLVFYLADFVYLIQELCDNCFIIPENLMASARLLNQITKIHETERWTYPLSFVIST